MPNHLHIVGGVDMGNEPHVPDSRDSAFLDEFEPTGRATFFTWAMVIVMGVGCVMIGFAVLSAWARVYPL